MLKNMDNESVSVKSSWNVQSSKSLFYQIDIFTREEI